MRSTRRQLETMLVAHTTADIMEQCFAPPGKSSALLEVPDMAVTAQGIHPFTATYKTIGGKINMSA